MPVILFDTALVADTFGTWRPTDGVTVNAYKASRFGSAPALGASPPGSPDAGPFITGPAGGSTGAVRVTVPTVEDYYLSFLAAGASQAQMAWRGPFQPSSGGGVVASVTAADTTVVVGGTTANPTVRVGSIGAAQVAAGSITKDRLVPLAIVDADVSAISEAKVTGLVSDLAAARAARVPQPMSSRAQFPDCYPPASVLSNGTNTAGTFRTKHHIGASCRDARLVYDNSYGGQNATTSLGAEFDGPNNITVRASIEQPDGTPRLVYFRGARSVVIEPGGLAISDPIGDDLAQGDLHVRSYVSVSAGQKWPFNIYSLASDGEGNNQGVPGADLTASGSVPTVTGPAFSPSAILGIPYVGQAGVVYLGDSIAEGVGDTTYGSGTIGVSFVQRAMINNNIGGTGICLWSETARDFGTAPSSNAGGTTGTSRRYRYVGLGCTHAICALGRNDIVLITGTLIQIQGYLTAIWQRLASRGLKVFQTTLTPTSTSTDSWATTTNQISDVSNVVRTRINNWIRTTPAPLTGYLEVADTVETARNSGIWKAPGYTADGVHPSTSAHVAMAGAIPAATFS